MPMSSEPPDRSLRALQDLLELQSRAVDNGVHEIRSLLLAGGYAKLLLDGSTGPLNALQRQYLQTIVQNTRGIKDVLDALSRAAECRLLEVTRFDAQDLLREILQNSARRFKDRWKWNGHASNAVCIAGDRKKLHEALAGILHEDSWSGDGLIGMRVEKSWIVISFRGPFAPGTKLLADQVLRTEGMSNRDSASVQGERIANSRDIVRMHGGSVSIQCFEAGDCEVTIKLPAMTPSQVMDEAPNV